MSTSIIYFSRTGRTKEISNELANQMEGSVYELKDDKNWNGFIGFIKAGFYASSDKDVNITYDPSCLASDQLIILSPIWAGVPTPAVRKFINEIQHDHMTLVLTNAGSNINKAIKAAKSQYTSVEHFFGITRRLDNSEDVIKTIVQTLK